MRRILIPAAVAAAVAATSVIAANSEALGTTARPCISNAEYQRIDVGSTKLDRITRMGGHGKITLDMHVVGEHWQDREYRRCGLDRWHGVAISYTDGTATYKGKW